MRHGRTNVPMKDHCPYRWELTPTNVRRWLEEASRYAQEAQPRDAEARRATEQRAEAARKVKVQQEKARAEENARREQERLQREADQREQARLEKRDQDLELIKLAKAKQAVRKHEADVAWAKRVLSEDGDASARAGRKAIPKAIRHGVWQRDRGRCVECGSRDHLEFDHVIPFADGGANTERNLQLLCEPCYRRKGRSLG